MMDGRLPAHVEVGAMLRKAQGEGGFATVIQRGERDAGVILLLTLERGENARLWERMPQLDGTRVFTCTKVQDNDNKQEFEEYLTRRQRQDPDSWLVELDIADAEHFIASLTA